MAGESTRPLAIRRDPGRHAGRARTFGLRQGAIAGAWQRGIQDSELGWLIVYVLRRRLDEAMRRPAATEPGEQTELVVGFIDMVDFTGTSAALDAAEFGHLLNRFEAIAWDVVTAAGGQVVKLIGDEAMFVRPSAGEAAAAGLDVLAASTSRAGSWSTRSQACCSRTPRYAATSTR